MITIWGRASSSNVQKVMWLVGELDLLCDRRDVGGKFGGLDSTEFLTLNPHGKIPVLQDGAVTLWESHAICRYLAATYGKDTFWEIDPVKRAKIDQWIEWLQTALQPTFNNGVFWGYFRTAADNRDHDAIARNVTATGALMAMLDARLGQYAYICGDEISLADIVIGSHLFRYHTLHIDWPDQPNLKRYYDGLTERNAYRTHVMVDYQELAG